MEDEALKRRERLKALRTLKSENPEAEISLKRMREGDAAEEEKEVAVKERKVEPDDEDDEEEKP